MESRRLQGTISHQIHKIEYHKALQIAKAKYLETKGSPIKDTHFSRRIKETSFLIKMAAFSSHSGKLE